MTRRVLGSQHYSVSFPTVLKLWIETFYIKYIKTGYHTTFLYNKYILIRLVYNVCILCINWTSFQIEKRVIKFDYVLCAFYMVTGRCMVQNNLQITRWPFASIHLNDFMFMCEHYHLFAYYLVCDVSTGCMINLCPKINLQMSKRLIPMLWTI